MRIWCNGSHACLRNMCREAYQFDSDYPHKTNDVMARVDEIHNASFDYLEANHSPSNVSECQAAMNIAVVKAYIAAAKWADETMIEKACKWLQENVCYDKNKECSLIEDFRKAMENS